MIFKTKNGFYTEGVSKVARPQGRVTATEQLTILTG
jgi:hypothetical protein